MKNGRDKMPFLRGKLKVEDSQTKLITCEYCGSQFPLDDEKVQHITNYTIYQTTPSGKDQGNGAKIAPWCWLWPARAFCWLLYPVPLVPVLPRAADRSAVNSRLHPPGPDTLGKEGEAGRKSGRGKRLQRQIRPLLHAMTWEMFQKEPSEISPEDLAGVRYLKVETSLETDRVWYSFDDPYSEKEPVVQTASLWVHGLGAPGRGRLLQDW